MKFVNDVIAIPHIWYDHLMLMKTLKNITRCSGIAVLESRKKPVRNSEKLWSLKRQLSITFNNKIYSLLIKKEKKILDNYLFTLFFYYHSRDISWNWFVLHNCALQHFLKFFFLFIIMTSLFNDMIIILINEKTNMSVKYH